MHILNAAVQASTGFSAFAIFSSFLSASMCSGYIKAKLVALSGISAALLIPCDNVKGDVESDHNQFWCASC